MANRESCQTGRRTEGAGGLGRDEVGQQRGGEERLQLDRTMWGRALCGDGERRERYRGSGNIKTWRVGRLETGMVSRSCIRIRRSGIYCSLKDRSRL